MKRWIALAAALMLAALAPLGGALADREIPSVPETFEDYSDRELPRAVMIWLDDAQYALYEAETEPELTELFEVSTETAALAMKEARNRYGAGSIDASVYESLISLVFENSIELCDVCAEVLDQLFSDGKIDTGTYLDGNRALLGKAYGFAESYIEALDQSLQSGIMDGVEYAGEADEALEDVMESCQDSFEICWEMLEEEMIPVDTYLVSIRDLSTASFRLLDRRTEILSGLHSAGKLEDGMFFKGLEAVISDRTEWIEALTETTYSLIQENKLTEKQQLASSAYLLDETSVLIEEYLFYLDGMRSSGKIDDQMYSLMKSLMDEFSHNLEMLAVETAEGVPAA